MRRRYYLRVKTKDGGIVGNIVIEAHDAHEAEHKLRMRYPNCIILNCEVR